MPINFLIIFIAALIPLVIGFIWYNEKVFGKAWMQESGTTAEKIKGSNMLLILGLTLLFSFMLAMSMIFMTIHQHHVTSLFYKQPINDPSTEMGALYKTIMDKLGASYRTFKHGALHGTFGSILTIVPVIAINALFERRSFKYIAIHAGYWILCMCLMGGIISAFS